MSFYKQYPSVASPKAKKIHKAVFVSVPIAALLVIAEAFLFDGAVGSSFLFLIICSIAVPLIMFLGKYLISVALHKTYLKKYGTKTDVVCTKVKKITFGGAMHFFFLLQGTKCAIKEPGDQMDKTLVPLSLANIKENDSFPVIYNPENPKNCILDEDKFNNK